MKIMNKKFLVAGLLAGALTFVGCKSDSSAEKGTTEPAQTPPPATGTDTGTGTDTSGTSATPGTGGAGQEKLDCTIQQGTGGAGGAGDISKTKQSDDNLRMPEDDPLRTKDPDTVRQGESEEGVHEGDIISPEPGTGGSGFETEPVPDNLNEGGNIDERRIPDSPADVVPEGVMDDSSQIPEGTR
jgi:hypothetical protein